MGQLKEPPARSWAGGETKTQIAKEQWHNTVVGKWVKVGAAIFETFCRNVAGWLWMSRDGSGWLWMAQDRSGPLRTAQDRSGPLRTAQDVAGCRGTALDRSGPLWMSRDGSGCRGTALDEISVRL